MGLREGVAAERTQRVIAKVPAEADGNLRAAVALHTFFYNFCRIHGSLKVTPAMKAGVTDRLWSLEDLFGENCG